MRKRDGKIDLEYRKEIRPNHFEFKLQHYDAFHLMSAAQISLSLNKLIGKIEREFKI
jgi:hypothetical protein